MDITIVRDERDDRVVLAVGGRLDAESASDLGLAVAEELRRGIHAVELDFTAISFLSSAGIRVLFENQRAAKQAGGSCLIVQASAPVRKVLDLTRLTPILMAGPQSDGRRPETPTTSGPRTAGPAIVHGSGFDLVGLEPSPAGPLRAELVGGLDTTRGFTQHGGVVRRPLPRHACAIGLAALGDTAEADARAGELLGVGGAVFHRPPQPFAAVDYLVGSGDLVADAAFVSGLVWQGVPGGRTGFETPDGGGLRLGCLLGALLDRAGADVIAVVMAVEVQGLVAAELIRPLTEATPTDHPWAADRDVAARWLCFSREPVHARRTALVAGVAARGIPAGPLAGFVRPLDAAGGLHGHLHAAVFPLHPLRRGPLDFADTIDTLAASAPLAVVHLVADPQPVLGSGESEFVRGGCWFAPLDVGAGKAS
jgi:anti-anti-sigma factor